MIQKIFELSCGFLLHMGKVLWERNLLVRFKLADDSREVEVAKVQVWLRPLLSCILIHSCLTKGGSTQDSFISVCVKVHKFETVLPSVQIKFYRGCKRKGKAQVFVRKVESGLLRRLKVRCDERKGPWRILSGVNVTGSIKVSEDNLRNIFFSVLVIFFFAFLVLLQEFGCLFIRLVFVQKQLCRHTKFSPN